MQIMPASWHATASVKDTQERPLLEEFDGYWVLLHIGSQICAHQQESAYQAACTQMVSQLSSMLEAMTQHQDAV